MSFGVIEFVAAVLLLVVGGLAGWLAHRRDDRRGRLTPEVKPGLKAPSEIAPQPGDGRASPERNTVRPEQTLPKEWDGSPLRPNLSRQINLARGLH